MGALCIRNATVADAAAIAAIYAPYVRETSITFEVEPPSAEEYAQRIEEIQRVYPFFVAEETELEEGEAGESRVVGYAYARRFGERAAYDWCAELSIYLAPEAQGIGLGRRLYAQLEAALRLMGVCNVYAQIADTPADDDPHLTHASILFHEALGYREVGRFRSCGHKFGRWYDIVVMEKVIAEHRSYQPPLTAYTLIAAIDGPTHL